YGNFVVNSRNAGRDLDGMVNIAPNSTAGSAVPFGGETRRSMLRRFEILILTLVLILGLALAGTAAPAQDLLVVNASPQAKTLPLHAGIGKGIFRARGLAVDLQLTENSRSQRDGLAAGQFDVVHSAVDNALAMVEIGKRDVVIVAGGDSGMNEFYVQPEVQSFADMRGRTLGVDAPDTAYALQAQKILAHH